jgi:hypothetical protein
MQNAEAVPSMSYTKTLPAAADTEAGLKRPSLPDGRGLPEPKRPKRERPSVDKIINALASAVLAGSKENTKKSLLPGREIRELADSFIKKCQATTSAEDLDELLLQLAAEFSKNKKMLKREGTIKAWFNRYLSLCIHYFRYRRNVDRDRRKDQPSLAIEILHSIINTLLLTDGIVALSVITSFAGECMIQQLDDYELMILVRGLLLSEAASRSDVERQTISKGVAERLKGKLHMPNGLDMPNPIFYISFILDKENEFMDPPVRDCQSHGHLQAYRFLNFPNLALLRLHQAAEVISFSDLQVRWTEFTTSTPQFEKLRQLLRLTTELKESSAPMLRSLRGSLALCKSGQIDKAFRKLEHLEEDEVEGSDLQRQPDEERIWSDLVKDFSCLLSSRLSTCITDSLEMTKVQNVAWDPIGDWSGMGTTNFPDFGADETLDVFFDMS